MNGLTRSVRVLGLTALAFFLGACAQYAVPGRAADFRALGITADEQEELTDTSITRAMSRRPASGFPAVIAVLRVQDAGYRSHTARGYDLGDYSIVTVRDIEKDEDFASLTELPMVRSVVPLNRLVMRSIESEMSIREAASRVQADMVLLYTVDTRFGVETTVPALGVITLGLFPNDEARVTSTVSAALFDTRTGYVYALCEGTASAKQIANAWTNDDAVDQSRRRAEREAFEEALDGFRLAWKGVAEGYAGGDGASARASD